MVQLKTKMISLLVLFSAIMFMLFTIHLSISYISIQKVSTKDQRKAIEKIIELKNEQNNQTIKDYSGWTEMIAFTKSKDKKWANDNIGNLTSTMKITSVSVFDSLKKEVYSSFDTSKLKNSVPIDIDAIAKSIQKKPFCHFFQYYDNVLYEFYGAGIVRTEDAEKRLDKPCGYLVIGKKWDSSFIKDLESATDFDIRFSNKLEDSVRYKQRNSDSIYVVKKLEDCSGKTISFLLFANENILNTIQTSFLRRSILFVGLGVIALFVFFFFQRKLVGQPLLLISKALSKGETEPLESLHSSTLEFSQLKQLIYGFFEQKDDLQNKVEELQTLEEELRQNNEELTSLNEQIDIQKQELKEIIENQGDGFALLNREGVFTLVNPAACAIFELSSPDQLVGQSFHNLVDEKSKTELEAKLRNRARGGKDDYELSVTLPNNVKKIVQITGVPHYDRNNVIIGSIAVFRDITKIKATEQEILNKNNELKKYFTAIEQNYAAIVITDTEGRIEYVNPRFEEITGYTLEEVKGGNPRILKSGRTSAKTYEGLWQTIKSGNVWRGEFSNIKKNKEEYIEKAIISPIKNSEGEITNFIAIKEEITALKKAEKIIKEKNKQQTILINNLPAHIYFKDNQLRYQLINNSFAELLGLPHHEIIGKLDSDILVSKELAKTLNEIENEIISTKEPNLNYESSHIGPDGKTYWTSTSKVPYFNENDELVGIVGIVQDISQRKEQEQTILEQSRQFENTLNNLEDIYFKTDLEGNLLQASPSICQFFGYSSIEEILEYQAFDQLYKNNEKRKTIIDTILNEGKISHYSFKIKDKDGEVQYGETNAVLWFDKDNVPMGFEGIIRDVSERVKFEKMLNKLNGNLSESLETTNKQKVIIEKAHKDMTDSIKYAQTIQNGFLPQDELIKTYFDEYFLLFKPRDIVSGDFYYVNHYENKMVFAVADCTGHGVPGGFMTILGIIYLHEIVSQGKFRKASHILEHLRNRLKETFKSLGNDSKNGLDIALCVVDMKTNVLQYAGAFNPLYIIRDGILNEYTPTKNPIGHYLAEKPFTNNDIQLFDNDVIYLCSDGFQDQFGGEKNRKFTKRRFKEMLQSVHDKPLIEQNITINDTLDQWQDGYKQTDDITLFAVKWNSEYMNYNIL